jgi:hypothetical protein
MITMVLDNNKKKVFDFDLLCLTFDTLFNSYYMFWPIETYELIWKICNE